MKLDSILLQNFSSHRQSQIDFDRPVTIIVGTLNAGKSSILQAIEYCLTGDCGAYRKRTDDRNDLIHDIAMDVNSGLSVHLKTDKGVFIRTRNAAAGLEAWQFGGDVKPTSVAMDNAVATAAGVPLTVLTALMNTSDFFSRDHTAQKQIIMGLLGAEVTWQKIQDLYPGDKEAFKYIRGTIDSLQALDNAYQYVFERRTVVKRELNQAKPPEPPDGPAPPLDKIKVLMTQCETELQSMISERGRLEGMSSAVVAVQGLQRRRTEAVALTAMKPTQEQQKALEDAVQEANITRQNLLAYAEEMDQKFTESRNALAVLEQNVKLLTAFNGRCVAGDHVCPATQIEMDAARDKQKSELDKLVKRSGAYFNSIAEAKAAANNLDKIRAAESALLAFKHNVERYRQAVAAVNEIDAELAKLKVPTTAPDNTAKIQDLNIQITAMRNRIADGKRKMEEAAAWLERQRQVGAVAETRKKLETELYSLESLCEYLGPKGVRLKLIDERIGTLLSEVNKYLAILGFDMHIQTDPWLVTARGRNINRLSRSERFRMGMAFQIALAKWTNVNFVLTDDCEILTPAVRGAAFRMLAESEVQAIAVMTLMVPVQEFVANKPNNPSIRFIVVENDNGVSKVRAI